MPKKLQLKLMSNSGELLNVISCFAGQVAVFRATAQGDLRPYQRALCGSQGRERFSVIVDGAEYRPEDHILIGFGEAPPHIEMTTRQFLAKQGVPDGSMDGLLMSYGLEGTGDKLCATLTPDEERRLRLVAATCQPQRIIITNEPFEPVASQWRERMAELLANHARTKNAIVIVTGLSYRPESWIDNEAVARVQVGETVQRTIGFGQAGSSSNALMNQLKDLIRDDAKVQELVQQQSRPGQGAAAAAAAASAVAVNIDELDGAISDVDGAGGSTTGLSSSFQALLAKFGLSTLSPAMLYTIAGGGVITLGLAMVVGSSLLTSEEPTIPPPGPQTEVARHVDPKLEQLAAVMNQPGGDEAKTIQQKQPQNILPPSEPVRVVPPPPVELPPSRFVLDDYPEIIRTSVLDTTRGIMGDPIATDERTSNAQAVPNKQVEKPGNLFKLLENASTNQPDKAPGGAEEPGEAGYPGNGQPSTWSQPPPPSTGMDEESSDEQARREAIRQKFLEAIRAAAERRQATMDGGEQ